MSVELITDYDLKIVESKLKKSNLSYQIEGGRIFINEIDTTPLRKLADIFVDDIMVDWEGNLLLYSEMSKKRL